MIERDREHEVIRRREVERARRGERESESI